MCSHFKHDIRSDVTLEYCPAIKINEFYNIINTHIHTNTQYISLCNQRGPDKFIIPRLLLRCGNQEEANCFISMYDKIHYNKKKKIIKKRRKKNKMKIKSGGWVKTKWNKMTNGKKKRRSKLRIERGIYSLHFKSSI